MGDLNPTILIMTLNVNCLNTASERLSNKQDKKQKQFLIHKIPTFNVKNRLTVIGSGRKARKHQPKEL